MKTVAVIQARMGSTRLPGKVLLPLCGTTVLGHVVRRVRACALVDAIVVATSERAADAAVAEEAVRHAATVYRGSEDDVLSRYHGAAAGAGATVVVRVTSDCPMFDPDVLQGMLELFHRREPDGAPAADYLSNTLGRRTFPRGLDAEIMTMQALERAHREASEPYQREHVTPYLYEHPEKFVLRSYENSVDHSAHRWTLDTAEDYQLISAVYGALCSGAATWFSTTAVLAFLEAHPAVAQLNAGVRQKELRV